MIPVNVLSVQFLPNADPALRQALDLPTDAPALALISTDCDDATYIALDEATKAAPVLVAYSKSLYAGAANASTGRAGEVIGILAGPSPAEVQSGMAAALAAIERLGFTETAARQDVVYLAHTVSSCGSFLANQANVPTGRALAYLIAPPVEAIVGLDAALKAADVRLATLFAPPSETNFGGGLLTGEQSACKVAAAAFGQAVEDVAARPVSPV